MAEIVLKHVQKVYPNNESKKKGFFGKKKKTEEKKHNLKVTEDGVLAVEDFNLTVHDQEFVVLVGPSGCGKSTTMRMVAGLEDITSGDVLIDGKRVNDVAPKDRDIAMVFQSYALYPHMTVYKNIAFGLELRKTPKDEIDRRVHEAAKILEIEHLLDRKPKALSGGQRQRVALGRAMVRNPAVFLLDEPLSNLDAKLRTSMRTEIIKLHKKLATTFIYVTHDQTEAMTMGDRIVVMKDGIIQQVDTPQNLYDMPCNMFVAGFIGSPQMNFLDGTIVKKGDQYSVDLGGQIYEVALDWKDNTWNGSVRYNGQVAMLVTKSSCTVASIFASNHLGGTPERDTAKWPADVQELAITPKAESMATTNDVNVRSAPSTNSEVFMTMPTDTVVAVTGVSDETDDGAKERKSDAEVRLEELQTLYDRRLITEEEYQQKRRKILDEL